MNIDNQSRVVQMTRDGFTAQQIAAALGVCERTINRVRMATGVGIIKPPPMSDDEIAISKRLLEDGASYMEVARTLNRYWITIRDHVPGYGWTIWDTAVYNSTRHKRKMLEI